MFSESAYYKYCDTFGQVPSLLGNHKLNALVITRQLPVKHFHGYAHLSGRQMVFLLGKLGVVQRRQDTTEIRSVQFHQQVVRDQFSARSQLQETS
jgi:hypothetical protein